MTDAGSTSQFQRLAANPASASAEVRHGHRVPGVGPLDGLAQGVRDRRGEREVHLGHRQRQHIGWIGLPLRAAPLPEDFERVYWQSGPAPSMGTAFPIRSARSIPTQAMMILSSSYGQVHRCSSGQPAAAHDHQDRRHRALRRCDRLPTDSCYALGCQLGNSDGITTIRSIRGLDDRHHLTLVCQDFAQLGQFVYVPKPVFRAIKAATPGPYTFILPATKEVPRRLQHPGKKTVGVRIPATWWPRHCSPNSASRSSRAPCCCPARMSR